MDQKTYLIAVSTNRRAYVSLFRALTWFIQLIHGRRRYDVVHVELMDERGRCVSAWNPEGVGIRDAAHVLKRFANNRLTVMAVPVIFDRRRLAALAFERCCREEGRSYDMVGAVRAGIDWLERWGIGIGIVNPKQLFCSQLVARGFFLSDEAEITPAQVAGWSDWNWRAAVPLKQWLAEKNRQGDHHGKSNEKTPATV